MQPFFPKLGGDIVRDQEFEARLIKGTRFVGRSRLMTPDSVIRSKTQSYFRREKEDTELSRFCRAGVAVPKPQLLPSPLPSSA